MKLLALDSSGLVASVAIVSELGLLAEYTVNYKKTHSQTLLPMLDEIVRMLGIPLSELGAIAVAAGPGSFTGLRIGAATAKGLGLALKLPIISVPTVDSLAYNLYGTDRFICPLMDAKRNQVYTGLYDFNGGQFRVWKEQTAIGIEDILEEINQYNREVIFLGDGVPVYENIIEEKIRVPYSFAPAHVNRQRAGAVGALGLEYYRKGAFEAAQQHSPIYLRVSQAERERMERLQDACQNSDTK